MGIIVLDVLVYTSYLNPPPNHCKNLVKIFSLQTMWEERENIFFSEAERWKPGVVWQHCSGSI